MNLPPQLPSRALDATARLKTLVQRLSRLQTRLSGLEENLDSVLFGLRDLQREMSGLPCSPTATRRTRRARSAHKEILGREAEKGVSRVRIERFVTSADLHIEGAPPVRLARGLADLLEVLLEDHGGPGILVDWKTFDYIRSALEKKSRRAPNRNALTNRIFRLRDELESAGENPFLVQTLKGVGARFALRRDVAQPPPQATRPSDDE